MGTPKKNGWFVKVLKGHKGAVLCLNYCKEQLVSTSSDSTVRIYSVKIGDNNKYSSETKKKYISHINKNKIHTSVIVYPIINCLQILEFNNWCKYAFISNISNDLWIGNEKGKLYLFKIHLKNKNNNTNTQSVSESIHYFNQANYKKEGFTIIKSLKIGPNYKLQYYSKLHRLSITNIFVIEDHSFVVTLAAGQIYIISKKTFLKCKTIV